MGNNMCGYGAPTGNPPPQSYVLGVYEIYPYEGTCIQLCLETDACQSWSLNDANTECTLYNAPSEEYLEPLQTSRDWPRTYYYDASCYTCSDAVVALGCNTLSDSPPSGSSCGQLGLSSANAHVASYGSRSDIQSVNNCALNCMSDLDCLSFSTDQYRNLCFYYNQTASTVANHYRGNTTEQTLYDFRCFQASSVSGRCGYQKWGERNGSESYSAWALLRITMRCANSMFQMQMWYAYEHGDSCLYHDHVDAFWQRWLM